MTAAMDKIWEGIEVAADQLKAENERLRTALKTAADEIEQLRQDVENLKHDLELHLLSPMPEDKKAAWPTLVKQSLDQQ